MADILVRTSEMFGQQAVYALRRQWFCERGVRSQDRAHRGPHGWISNGALRRYLAKCGIGAHGAALWLIEYVSSTNASRITHA
jgi:hypothetical protein